MEKIQTQLKRYSGTFTDMLRESKRLKKTNEQLSGGLKEATRKSVKQKMQDIQPRRDYDNPKYNAAFDRCVDVMVRLMLKYGSAVPAKRKLKDGRLMELGGDRSELTNCQEAPIQQREKSS